MRTVQQRGPTAIPDYNTVISRSQVLNHVVLAEINFFQKEKVDDLSAYMKTLLNEQMQFYDKVNLFMILMKTSIFISFIDYSRNT